MGRRERIAHAQSGKRAAQTLRRAGHCGPAGRAGRQHLAPAGPVSRSADSTQFTSSEASWGLSTVCSPRPSLQPRARRPGAFRLELSTRSPFPPEVHRVAPAVTFPQSGILGANPMHAATLRCARLLATPLAEGQSPHDLGPPSLTFRICKTKDGISTSRVPLTRSHHSQPGARWAPDRRLPRGSPCGSPPTPKLCVLPVGVRPLGESLKGLPRVRGGGSQLRPGCVQAGGEQTGAGGRGRQLCVVLAQTV